MVVENTWWEVAADGSNSKKWSSVEIVVTSPEGFKVYYTLLFRFSPTNNEAKYEAFIAGMQYTKDLRTQCLRIQTNSALVNGQVMGNFEAKGDRLIQYRDRAQAKLREFRASRAEHVPRTENANHNILSKLVHEATAHISRIARIVDVPIASIDTLSVALA